MPRQNRVIRVTVSTLLEAVYDRTAFDTAALNGLPQQNSNFSLSIEFELFPQELVVYLGGMDQQPIDGSLLPSSFVGDENVVNNVPARPPRAPSKGDAKGASSSIPWKDPIIRKIFIGLVYRNKAYMVTTDSFTQKYNVIAYDLMNNYPEFKKYGLIKGSSIQKQYERERDALIKRLALDKEGANLSAINSFPDEDKLLYRMIVQTKDAPGDEADASKNAFNRARLQGILADKTSMMLEKHKSSALDEDDFRIKRVKRHEEVEKRLSDNEEEEEDEEEGGVPVETPMDSANFVRRGRLPSEDLSDYVDKLSAKFCPPEVLEAKKQAMKNAEDAQKLQAEKLDKLAENTNDVKNSLGELTGGMNKMVNILTAMLHLQSANNGAMPRSDA